MPKPEPLSQEELLARLRDVQGALRDMPPHAASGTRERLEAERTRLQRELAGPTSRS